MPQKPSQGPASHARKSYHHGDLRSALLDHAVAMLTEQGDISFSRLALAKSHWR